MKMFQEACKVNNVIFPFPDNFQNISDLFAQKKGLKKGIGLKAAIKMMGLNFDGEQHSALWDSYNTAKLFLNIME